VAAVSIASAGCGEGKEKTVVQLHYRLAPTKHLPPGMKTLAVLPAETTDEADAKWSELASNMVQGLLAQANDQFGCGLRFADRASVKRVLDEKDLTLSGQAAGRRRPGLQPHRRPGREAPRRGQDPCPGRDAFRRVAQPSDEGSRKSQP
jgi:hypothetical protein